MTTDIVPKAASRKIKIKDKEVVISGVSKGSGMIHPNMATMLSFIATDASINQILLDKLLKEATGESDRKSTRLNSSHSAKSRMPSSA